MNDVQVEQTETQAAEKAPKQHPCLCSKLEVLVNVREDHEHSGGDLIWDEEHTTGCDPETLTSKTFRPGHDAKAVSFLLEAHQKGWEVSVLDGGMRTTAAPEIIAVTLGDALFEKYSRAVANFDKKEAEKAERAREREARRAQAKKDKAEKSLVEEVEAAKAEAESGEHHEN